MTIFCVLWRKETKICQQNCFFHTIVSGIGPLSCSELDIFGKKYVEFSDNACFTDGNPRSELFICDFFISKYFLDLIDEAEYLAACAVLFL